jgi:lipopolysaccharide export system permease protein
MGNPLRRPATLWRYVLRLFLPYFAGAVLFFVLIVELIDLFGSLWRYLALGVPVSKILGVVVLYAPTCLSYALPVALLFATAFTLGSLYASNELVAVFSAGNRLSAFVAPLLAVGLALSVFSFFFSDGVVLGSYREKGLYSRKLLGQNVSLSNSDVAVIARDGQVVYRAEYYDDAGRSMSNVTIIERDPGGKPVARTEAVTARWDGEGWELSRVRRFSLGPDGKWSESHYGTYRDKSFDEAPSTFRSQNLDVKEMSVNQLGTYVAFLRRAGLPFEGALAERHKRFAFSFAPFIVVLISSALGGRFRKNVLLASLLASLLVATAYYVTQMLTMLMAKTGVLPPALGAWIPLALFGGLGVALFRKART